MATHLRMRCAWQFTDTDPKNQAVINPCFRVNGPFTDAQQLCVDLATALDNWITGNGGTPSALTVRSYDIEGTKPVYPNGQTAVHTSTIPVPGAPPEVAVCLSYYSQFNQPRRRGRVYLPYWLMSTASASAIQGSTINTAVRSAAMALASRFASLGGANVDWIVWSGRDHAAHQVDNYWVDDGWDIQRSRGLKSKVRSTGTTSGLVREETRY